MFSTIVVAPRTCHDIRPAPSTSIPEGTDLPLSAPTSFLRLGVLHAVVMA